MGACTPARQDTDWGPCSPLTVTAGFLLPLLHRWQLASVSYTSELAPGELEGLFCFLTSERSHRCKYHPLNVTSWLPSSIRKTHPLPPLQPRPDAFSRWFEPDPRARETQTGLAGRKWFSEMKGWLNRNQILELQGCFCLQHMAAQGSNFTVVFFPDKRKGSSHISTSFCSLLHGGWGWDQDLSCLTTLPPPGKPHTYHLSKY